MWRCAGVCRAVTCDHLGQVAVLRIAEAFSQDDNVSSQRWRAQSLAGLSIGATGICLSRPGGHWVQGVQGATALALTSDRGGVPLDFGVCAPAGPALVAPTQLADGEGDVSLSQSPAKVAAVDMRDGREVWWAAGAHVYVYDLRSGTTPVARVHCGSTGSARACARHPDHAALGAVATETGLHVLDARWPEMPVLDLTCHVAREFERSSGCYRTTARDAHTGVTMLAWESGRETLLSTNGRHTVLWSLHRATQEPERSGITTVLPRARFFLRDACSKMMALGGANSLQLGRLGQQDKAAPAWYLDAVQRCHHCHHVQRCRHHHGRVATGALSLDIEVGEAKVGGRMRRSLNQQVAIKNWKNGIRHCLSGLPCFYKPDDSTRWFMREDLLPTKAKKSLNRYRELHAATPTRPVQDCVYQVLHEICKRRERGSASKLLNSLASNAHSENSNSPALTASPASVSATSAASDQHKQQKLAAQSQQMPQQMPQQPQHPMMMNQQQQQQLAAQISMASLAQMPPQMQSMMAQAMLSGAASFMPNGMPLYAWPTMCMPNAGNPKDGQFAMPMSMAGAMPASSSTGNFPPVFIMPQSFMPIVNSS
ncbi:uncharacterized protein MONBRDRAFT_37994 [Monosiga brevicollis MX1]|uniref:Uncharacterized protein n=1 Tax=Monosiga brevicollis TaxID=81824 RepID=A9V529_MONBE|nr:uncharacterized protein MONBRDRAFT_37994 [Monosiga brevicollis MX1]EDQ87203.1 predicted protein [Monosiga brevicollis MX1]|eukprot:XP_001747816.1 hypothetical protein [Monosiga brevicollis MX1]